MSASDEFYSLLFEISHELRYRILLFLNEKAMRLTEIAKILDLNHPEIRRHVTRLRDIGLITRDVDGYYHLTPYGETSIILFQEFEFLSANSQYFEEHNPSGIPIRFLKRIGELLNTMSLANAMDYFRYTDNLLRESKEYVWLLVDQFPLNSLSTIIEAIERGVKFKIIENKDRILNPNINAMTSEETQALSRAQNTPLVEQRMLNETNVFLVLSEKRCVFAFPTSDGQYDYMGFTATDDSSLKWCNELFEYNWSKGDNRTPVAPKVRLRRALERDSREALGQIVVSGRDDSNIDAQAVQDAVDNYDEVILSGKFNFGTSMVHISRSVIIKGEGGDNNLPSAEIYKKDWIFPFTEYDRVFLVNGEGIDVTIENIHFTDFNCTCIEGQQGNSLNIKSNRITLETGYGRGMIFGAFGDLVMGILLVNHDGVGNFPGGAMIEDNYIDFARGGARGGYIPRGKIEEDPDYRPNLLNHEYYMGMGITVNHSLGEVIIDNNTIKNANARGILAYDNMPLSDVRIRHNLIESDVFGSYAFHSSDAGIGIMAQSGFSFPRSNFNIEISENTIRFEKRNYCGIAIHGPIIYREGVGKLSGGFIKKNSIHLNNGYIGIHIRKSDNYLITDNRISGKSYYGIKLSGRRKSGNLDLKACNNMVEDNDLDSLEIKCPDKYSNTHVDDRIFTGSEGKSKTAHFWLNRYTNSNVVNIQENQTIIDEGENNKISIN